MLEISLFLKKVYSGDMSVYLRYFIQLCLVTYYDCFEELQLHKAAQYFDYFIGSLRMSKYYVRSEAVKNSLTKAPNNLLDILIGAYRPQEVFDFIAGLETVKKS